MVHYPMEKRLLTSSCPEHMILILGFLLILIWGSLRFSDAQRINLRSLVYNGENLRGLSWRTKTTNRGQAFGVIAPSKSKKLPLDASLFADFGRCLGPIGGRLH